LALAEVPCLLVSELVTNAIVHTNNSVALPLCLAGRRLRTSVADESSRLPELRACELDEDRVRGLQLVEALAEDWGVETTAAGKAVWFEVDLAVSDRPHWGRTHRVSVASLVGYRIGPRSA